MREENFVDYMNQQNVDEQKHRTKWCTAGLMGH